MIPRGPYLPPPQKLMVPCHICRPDRAKRAQRKLSTFSISRRDHWPAGNTRGGWEDTADRLTPRATSQTETTLCENDVVPKFCKCPMVLINRQVRAGRYHVPACWFNEMTALTHHARRKTGQCNRMKDRITEVFLETPDSHSERFE